MVLTGSALPPAAQRRSSADTRAVPRGSDVSRLTLSSSAISEPPQRASLWALAQHHEGAPEDDSSSQIVADSCTSVTTKQVKASVRRVVLGGSSIYIKDGDGLMADLRMFAIGLLLSPSFDTVMGVIISVNSVTIGFELSFRLRDRSTQVIEDLEHFFLIVYMIELGLRFIALRLEALRDKSVIFDCVLVFSGMLITWCLGPLGLANVEGGGVDPGLLVVLRTLRLLRLARAVRLLVKFRELWMLVRSLMNSASTMFYVMILMVIILYILACVGCEVIGMHDLARGTTDTDPLPEFELIVREHFDTIGLTMMTLVQFVCLDSIAAIFKPLCKLDPMITWYFMGSVLLLGIVLMNLITAVVVNCAMEQSQQDRELLAMQELEQKERLVKDLRKMFSRLDMDGSGQISRDEICEISETDRQTLYNVLSIAEPTELFDALDVDESGHLDIEEFVDGIWQVTISKAPIEIKRISKQVKLVRDDVRELSAVQAQIRQALVELGKIVQTATAEKSVPRTSVELPPAHVSEWAPLAQVPAPADWVDDISIRLRASLQDGLREVWAQTVNSAVDARPCTPEPPTTPEIRPSPQASPRTTFCSGDLRSPALATGPTDASGFPLVQRLIFAEPGTPSERPRSRTEDAEAGGGCDGLLDGSRMFPLSV